MMSCIMPNFTLIGIHFRSRGGKKTANMTKVGNMGALVLNLLADQGKVSHASVDPQCTLPCEISSGSVYCVTLERRSCAAKTPNLAIFPTNITHFSMEDTSKCKMRLTEALEIIPHNGKTCVCLFVFSVMTGC